MREIKFRAKVNGVYVYSDSYVNLAFYFDATKGYEQQQYTGLKDKNGKEIYEGDYVKWTFGKHYWEAIIQTVPNNKSNTLYAIETYHNCTSSEDETVYTFQRSDSRKGSRNDIEYISSNIEVIGNIYENPELLKND